MRDMAVGLAGSNLRTPIVGTQALLLLSGLATLVCLEPGLPGASDLQGRAAWIEAHTLLWRLGWTAVGLGMCGLVAFLVWWASRLHWTTGTSAALALAGAALALDVVACVWLAGAPAKAAATTQSLGSMLGTAGATPLYVTAILMLIHRMEVVPPSVSLLGILLVTGALLMAVSAVLGWGGLLRVGAVLTFTSVPLLCLRFGMCYAERPRPHRAHDYHMTSKWTVRASPEELAAVFQDLGRLESWWHRAFLRSTPSADGWRVDLHTKGWLPYTLRLQARILEANCPVGFVVDTCGDLVGRCVCRVEAVGENVHVHFDWRVRAEKPIVRRLSWLLKPLFASNHRWVMREGARGLRRELRRRRGIGLPS